MNDRNMRNEFQIKAMHVWGYCMTNNCKQGFPQSKGINQGYSGYVNDENVYDCEDKVKS